MAHLTTSNFSFPLPPLIIQPLPVQEPAAKRGHFEEYEDSSPSHSESESSRSSNSAPESRASTHEDENVHEPLTVSTDTAPTITLDAKFESYKQFEEVFEAWKKEQFHPFRVASSETLKESDGTVNPVFKYRYVVYHCAHYGEPRMRGIGKRPNQTYLPCGCRAMLRVNYSFPERILKITTLVDVHTGHEQNADIYHKAMTKSRGSLSPAGIPAKRAKRDHDSTYSSSPLSMRNSPINSTAASVQSSPASTVSPASMAIQHALLIQQQQQNNLMAALMNQQKENQMNPSLTTQQLQYALHSLQQRPQLNQSPAILTMINQLSLPLFNLPQPAHGVVAPQPAVQMKTHTEHANELIDVVNEFNLPANLPAPKPIKRDPSPPPVLERVDLETLKPAVLSIKTEIDTETGSQQKMKTVLEEMISRVPSLSSEQITMLLPQLETMLTLFKQ